MQNTQLLTSTTLAPPVLENWNMVRDVVTPEQVKEMYLTVQKLQKLTEAQDAKLRERDEADLVRDQLVQNMQKMSDELGSAATHSGPGGSELHQKPRNEPLIVSHLGCCMLILELNRITSARCSLCHG